MGVSERIAGPNRDNPYSRGNPRPDALASVVRYLQDINLVVRYGYSSFNITGQESRGAPGIQEEHHGVVVLSILSRNPVGGRMQDRERAKLLAGGYPPNGDLTFLNLLNEVPISRRHWISPQPELANLKILNDIKKSIHVVVMRVGQDDGVQTPNSPREEVG